LTYRADEAREPSTYKKELYVLRNEHPHRAHAHRRAGRRRHWQDAY